MITKVKVLNTVADNGTDAYVDSTGYLNITGGTRFKARQIIGMQSQAAVAQTLGVFTFTFTAANSYSYYITVTGYLSSGQLVTLPFSYTSLASGDTATTIGNAFRTMITNSGLQITPSGTSTMILTAISPYPDISGANPTSDPNIAVSQTTPGVARVGYGADLITEYGGYIATTDTQITSTASYTQWKIDQNGLIMVDGYARTESGISTIILLINEAATTSGSNLAAMNIGFLQGTDYTYVGSIGGATITAGTIVLGTLPALARGYRAIITSPATTTAAVTVTSGAIALSGGSATFTTLDATINDTLYISVSGTTAFTTYGITTITAITSATAGTGTCITAISAGVFKIYQLRALPL